ncbi:VIT1/CCC1 transporter family protein [Haloarchaeobius sp. DYHT-AS-18]|uniref:VIT1/CCC1 transporter family protein n=1 Tax=Haloarchaeobius sp. DYHT-AS-18 TaxID=3446117 RepID=UPI003EBC0431
MSRLDALQAALRRPSVRSISRRYFVSNGFDGTLTSIGVATGAYLSGVPDGRTVVLVGVGGAVGLCTSGVWSVWEIERAEKLSQRRELERAMLRDLDDTHLQREDRAGRAVNAIASGVGPLVGTLTPLVPFLFEGWLVSLLQATLLSVAVGVGLLFAFGAYMGSIAELNWTVTGIRMALAGVLVAVVNVLLPG